LQSKVRIMRTSENKKEKAKLRYKAPVIIQHLHIQREPQNDMLFPR
jgi:hypothetical protein